MTPRSAERMDATPDTFYAAAVGPRTPRPRLALDVDTGVCIVGGGLAGLWIARALVRRGQDVVVLEAGRIGDGAAGRNGGFCSAGFSQELGAIVERVGLDHARALYKLSREGVDQVRALIAEGAPGLEPVPGRLSVLRHDDAEGIKRTADDLAEFFDHVMVVWPTERVRATLKSERYYQALHDADALNINPLSLTLALAAEVEQGGGRIYEESAAVAADLDGVRKWVATANARVRAHQIVFCGSAAIGAAFPQLQRCILPIGTHLSVTAPLGERLHEAIAYGGGISDTRRAFDYYRVIGDRLLWGGHITTRTRRPRRLERTFARDILSVYPQLEGVVIEYAWTGTMGYAVHRMPQLGMLRPGVWIASAFGGQGINTTAMAGHLISCAIIENDDRWRLFAPFGMVWAGGALGRATAQIMYWTGAARDWIDGKRAKRAEVRRREQAERAAAEARIERLAQRQKAAVAPAEEKKAATAAD